MIVTMKKVTLLALHHEHEKVLDALRELGVMQVSLGQTFSETSAELKEKWNHLKRSEAVLRQFAGDEKISLPEEMGRENDGYALADEVADLVDKRTALLTEENELLRRQEELAVWGDFDSALLNKLRNDGVDILLCQGTVEEFSRALTSDNDGCFEVGRSKGKVAFAVVGIQRKLSPADYPVIQSAKDEDPRRIAGRLQEISVENSSVYRKMSECAGRFGDLSAALIECSGKFEFSRVCDSLAEHGAIAVLSGFVPEPEIEKLSMAAKKSGWGLYITDPAEDDDVPVLLKDNKFTRVIKPLFDFLGIVPGYREIDISGGILIFFTIFYAIIIGDAGYGVIFGLISLAGLRAAKKVPKLLPPMRLFLVLSIATTIWGALCGSWFGMATIPGTDKPFPALECFRDFASNSAKQANIQFFCFILAVVQLSAGRIWRVVRERNWRAAGQHLGWMLIIWGNFFLTIRLIVYPGEFPKFMYGLYGVGLVLVMCCGVNWKQASDVFQFPFDIIGSFTDVLSYIRLFAVGLAGACIAGSFNGMAFDLCQVSKWLLPAGALVVIAGHALNIALALLGVLVHAVRLNTLEFSNHTGLSWSGQSFNPFKSNKTKE